MPTFTSHSSSYLFYVCKSCHFHRTGFWEESVLDALGEKVKKVEPIRRRICRQLSWNVQSAGFHHLQLPGRRALFQVVLNVNKDAVG